MSDLVLLWQSVEEEQYLRNGGADFLNSRFKENAVVLNNYYYEKHNNFFF